MQTGFYEAKMAMDMYMTMGMCRFSHVLLRNL